MEKEERGAPSFASALLMVVLLTTGTAGGVHGGGAPQRGRSLFVFGDSYADTGNIGKIVGPSWNEPYGVTFPKKPAGRFSDGRVFTDYLDDTVVDRRVCLQCQVLAAPAPAPATRRSTGPGTFKTPPTCPKFFGLSGRLRAGNS